MIIRYRSAAFADLPHCLAILQDSRAYGNRLNAYLPALWHELLIARRVCLLVVEEETPEGARLLGFRCGCFISDDFARAICAGLPPCLSAQLYQRHGEGKSPILTQEGLGKANAGEGVSVFAFTAHRQEIYEGGRLEFYAQAISNAFAEIVKGYRLKEAFVENYGAVPLQHMRNSGYHILTDYADHYTPTADPESRFFVVHLTQQQARQEQGTAMSRVFMGYTAPRFGFKPSEQEMLEYALENDTESWLAKRCCCAPITIKKRWESIYARVEQYDPNWFLRQATNEPAEAALSRRHLLLKYLRAHYEELRPYHSTTALQRRR